MKHVFFSMISVGEDFNENFLEKEEPNGNAPFMSGIYMPGNSHDFSMPLATDFA
jgi:hypothetical protein